MKITKETNSEDWNWLKDIWWHHHVDFFVPKRDYIFEENGQTMCSMCRHANDTMKESHGVIISEAPIIELEDSQLLENMEFEVLDKDKLFRQKLMRGSNV